MRTIHCSEQINTTPETLYTMLTDGGQLERWFPTAAETTPEIGEGYTFTFSSSKHPEMDHVRSGEFTELEPGRRVGYTWPVEETSVRFSIEDINNGCRVTLEHSGWGDDAASDRGVEEHTNGWGFFLQNLKSVIETGVDRRAEMWG